MRYFKKLDPKQGILLSNGSWQKFGAAGKWGIMATEDVGLINEFMAAIKGERGGIIEIDATEYDSLKKKRQLWRCLREEISQKMFKLFLKSGEYVVGVGPVAVDDKKSKLIAKPAGMSGWKPVGVAR